MMQTMLYDPTGKKKKVNPNIPLYKTIATCVVGVVILRGIATLFPSK